MDGSWPQDSTNRDPGRQRASGQKVSGQQVSGQQASGQRASGFQGRGAGTFAHDVRVIVRNPYFIFSVPAIAVVIWALIADTSSSVVLYEKTMNALGIVGFMIVMLGAVRLVVAILKNTDEGRPALLIIMVGLTLQLRSAWGIVALAAVFLTLVILSIRGTSKSESGN